MNVVPKIDKIIETANVPSDPGKPFQSLTQTDVYRSINNYYKMYTDVDSLSYKFVDKDTEETLHRVQSCLYDPGDINPSEFEDMGTNYSNYNQDGIEVAGLDSDEIWNGDSSILVYDQDGKVRVGKTDYYTSTIFSRLLYVEAANALDRADGNLSDVSMSDYPLRNEMLSTKKQFSNTPSFSTGASSGGVIVGREDGKWEMLLARRSKKPRVNQGFVSMVPNGGVEYEDYHSDISMFRNTLKREFSEELFASSEIGEVFFEDKVESEQVSLGWNMRSGNLSAGYALFLESDAYSAVKDSEYLNFEFSEKIEVEIDDIDDVSEILSMEEMSPSVIPTVVRTLQLFNEKEDLPSLSYHIENLN